MSVKEEEMTEEKFFANLDNIFKSRSEKKRLEYINKLKEKRGKKKAEKRKKKNTENGPTSDLKDNTFFAKPVPVNNEKNEEMNDFFKEENIEIEYVDEDNSSKFKVYEEYKSVFEFFNTPKKEKVDHILEEEQALLYGGPQETVPENEKANENQAEEKKEQQFMSKKKQKKLKRMKISELKQKTNKPEVVEAWDVTSQDPILLVTLKSLKNTIQVPKHWSQKRKFLQNKRGILKPPFQLPDFIEATGISKIRDTTTKDHKSLRQKMRERMQPKMGRMDIDYQVLHDAFFKNQSKLKLSVYGDIYYENKEYEVKMRIYKPGRITEKLRVALGIPENSAPPWIINMQRYGPPPAYPNLKIPGVNAPICDPTAEITPNLWTPPVNEDKGEFVFRNSKRFEHWGDLKDEEEEPDNQEGELSIESDPEGEDNNFNPNANMNFERDNFAKLNANEFKAIDFKEAVPNPNQVINTGTDKLFEEKNSFYQVLEQVPKNVKEGEIYGSSHGYLIPKIEEKKQESEENVIDKVEETKENEVVKEKKKDKKKNKYEKF